MKIITNNYQVVQSLGKYKAVFTRDCSTVNIGVISTETYADTNQFHFNFKILSKGKERDIHLGKWSFSYIINGISSGSNFNPWTEYKLVFSYNNELHEKIYHLKTLSFEDVIAHIFDVIHEISCFASYGDFSTIDSLSLCAFNIEEHSILLHDFDVFASSFRIIKELSVGDSQSINHSKIYLLFQNKGKELVSVINKMIGL